MKTDSWQTPSHKTMRSNRSSKERGEETITQEPPVNHILTFTCTHVKPLLNPSFFSSTPMEGHWVQLMRST